MGDRRASWRSSRSSPACAWRTSEFPRLPALRARTAREASLSEARQSPLNALVVVVLAAVAVALLPVWRPVGRAGVPVGTLSHAPQDLAVAVPGDALPLPRQGMGPASMGILVRVRSGRATSRLTRGSSSFPRRCGVTRSSSRRHPATGSASWIAMAPTSSSSPPMRRGLPRALPRPRRGNERSSTATDPSGCAARRRDELLGDATRYGR